MAASSLGVDDALLRKLVDIVDVGHTKKGLKPKRKCQKRPEEKKKILKNLQNLQMISSADPKKIVDENKSKLFLKLSLDLKFKNLTNAVKKSVPSFKPSSIFAKDILMIR